MPRSRLVALIPNLIPKRLDDTGSGQTIRPREAPFLEHMDALGCWRMTHFGFQINAYMDNLPDETLTDTCQMMLLYPTVNSPLSATFTHKGHKISIRAINLNQPWQSIRDDLLALVA